SAIDMSAEYSQVRTAAKLAQALTVAFLVVAALALETSERAPCAGFRNPAALPGQIGVRYNPARQEGDPASAATSHNNRQRSSRGRSKCAREAPVRAD